MSPSNDRIRYRYTFGSAEFDEARFELRIDGKVVRVEHKPLELLLELLRRPNEVVPRTTLRERLWPTFDRVDHVLGNAVRKLRDVLGGAVIVTTPKSGYRLAVEIHRVAVGRGYEVRGIAELRAAIQDAYSALNEVDMAVETGRAAVAAAMRAAGPDDALTLETRLQLARDLGRSGRYDEAHRELDTLAGALGEGMAARPAIEARWWWVRSDLEGHALKLGDSLASAERAQTALRRQAAPDPPLADLIEKRLGVALRMLGEHARSERVFRELVRSQMARDGFGAVSTQISRHELARCFILQDRCEAALEMARDVAERLGTALGASNPVTQQARDVVAAALYKKHDYAGAAALWEEIALALPGIYGKTTDWLVTVLSNVGLSHMQAGRPADALVSNERALEFARSLHGNAAPRTQSIRFQRAFCLIECGRTEGVDSLLDGLDPAALKLANQSDDWQGRIVYLQGRLALLEGRVEQATTLLETAAGLLEGTDPQTVYAPALVRRWLDSARRSAAKRPGLEIR